MSRKLSDAPRAEYQRAALQSRKEYIRLLEQLEFCVRNKVDPAKVLIDLASFRSRGS